MLCTPLNLSCFTSEVVVPFVHGLAGAKPFETFLITIDYRKAVYCFLHPKVHVGSMASELMYWQASGMLERFDKWCANAVDVGHATLRCGLLWLGAERCHFLSFSLKILP